MDQERWQHLRKLVEAAEGIPSSDLGDWVIRRCDGDGGLERELRHYLATRLPEDFLEPVQKTVPSAAPRVEIDAFSAGARIGPYELVRPIGSGGMGAVFEAVQERPRRTVALKVMQLGFSGSSARQRFEYEAELLGRLGHPSVARVYEAGVHRLPSGGEVPWFAMELVEGRRDLMQYARQAELGRAARLELFLQICDGVQHGHQRGVLHRDLKPSNLLVDETGRPRVIDFGVARSIDPDARLSETLTRAGQILGTLAYMSPEQLEGEPDRLDVRSDVYALGVVLYELLLGRLPYDLDGAALHQAARTVTQVDPIDPRQLDPRFPEDLVWILSRALEKEPTRRYGTVAEFAADLRHHLRDEPVLASPPSATYRARKFVRRHRVATLAATVVAFALLTGAGLATGGMVEARESAKEASQQGARATAEAGRLRHLNEFLMGVFRSPSPMIDGNDVRVVDLLDRAREDLDRALEGDPDLIAAQSRAIAEAYFGLGRHEEALPLFRSALERELALHEPNHEHVLDVETVLQRSMLQAGESISAEDVRALRLRCEEALGPPHPVSLYAGSTLGELCWRQGRLDDAAEVYGEVIAAREFQGDPIRFFDMQILAQVHHEAGRLDAAQTLAETTIEELSAWRGEGDSNTLLAHAVLARILMGKGHFEDAATRFEAVAEGVRPTLGDDHPYRRKILRELAASWTKSGRAAEAEDLLLELLEGEDPPRDRVFLLARIASVRLQLGAIDQAGATYQEAIELALVHFGEQDPNTLGLRNNLARVLEQQGRVAEAIPVYEAVLATLEKTIGPSHPNALITLHNLGQAHLRLDDAAAAEPLLGRAADLAHAGLPEDHWLRGLFRGSHGRALVFLERYDEAEAELLAAHTFLIELQGESSEAAGKQAESLALLYERWGRPEEAARWSGEDR